MKQLGIQSLQKVSLVLSTITLLASACFITDCPRRRGKKNLSSNNALRNHKDQLRQCSLCGPSLGHVESQSYAPSATFRCFGEDLCCSTDFGCLPPKSAGSTICALEAAAAINPCKNNVPTCRSVPGGGQCVTEALCCNSKGDCNDDISCSTAVKRHVKIPPPYHASFSDLSSGHRSPDVAEVAAYEIIKELGTHPSPKWEALSSTHGRDISFPARSRTGLYTNSFYNKKSNLYPLMNKDASHNTRSENARERQVPRNKNAKLKETKRSLLRQFKELSNHYNSMRRLVSNGLGDYGTYGNDDDSTIVQPPLKRQSKIDEEDADIRLGVLGTMEDNNWYNN